ncbi:hypothetical protein [Nocardia sp. NPDC059154]|uniref:hypothetical protein n=1 Tax=Nocardia sp. NPDC059154 TaxID=3346744 RepID=UPI00367418D4
MTSGYPNFVVLHPEPRKDSRTSGSRTRAKNNDSGLTSTDADAQAECMRARDVVVGQTYAVLIPHRISPGRRLDRDQPGTPASAWWWMTGTRFRLTVTEVDSTSSPAMVEGRPITEGKSIEVVLTDEQVTALTALGLPGGEYPPNCHQNNQTAP